MSNSAIIANAIVYFFALLAFALFIVYATTRSNPDGTVSVFLSRIFTKLKSCYERFYYSYGFPAFVAIGILFFWAIKDAYLGIAFVSLLACPAFLVKRDVTPIYPLLFACVLLFRDFKVTAHLEFYTILLPALTCFTIKFFIHPIKKVYIGKMLFPLIVVSVALFCGGLFSHHLQTYLVGMVNIISLGPVLLFTYFFFSNYTTDEYVCSKQYVILSIVFTSLLAGAEIILSVITGFYLGGTTNTFSAILLLGIPLAFYLMCKSKNIFPFTLIIVLLYAMLITSRSHGSIAVMGVFTPFLLVYSYLKMDARNRAWFAKILYFTLILAIIIIAIFFKQFIALVNSLINSIGDNNGRTPLYLDAIRLFLQYPLFGGGLGYYNDKFIGTSSFSFNFHSSIFHVIGTMGTMGILAYSIYYFCRFRIVMGRNRPLNVFSFFAFGSFTAYASVDCGEFTAIPTMIIVTLLMLTIERANEKDSERSSLPLTANTIKF